MSHNHYHKDVSHLQTIDVYRVLDLYQVTSPPLQHAIKKLLCAGMRGAKDEGKDIQEAIDSLVRWQKMQSENNIEVKETEVNCDVQMQRRSRHMNSFNAGL